jgi:hypothetical protein
MGEKVLFRGSVIFTWPVKITWNEGAFQALFDSFSLLAAGIVNKFNIFCSQITTLAIPNVSLFRSSMKSQIRNRDALGRAAEV